MTDRRDGQRQPEVVVCPNCGHGKEIVVPDPFCADCGTWHLRGSHDLAAVRAKLLRELEDRVRALPAEGRRHVGMFVERQAVLGLLDPRRKDKAA